MGRIKRPMRRVESTGQDAFGFARESAPTPEQRQPIGDHRFIDDDAYQLRIGDVRLDTYLRKGSGRIALELRRVMGGLNYESLTHRYSQRGRRAFHPRTVLGLVIYGSFVRVRTLRDLERLSENDLGAMWICGGRRIDHSTIGRFITMHAETLSEEFFEAVTRWVIEKLGLKAGVSSIDATVVESAGSRWRALKAEAAREAAEKARAAAAAAPGDEQAENTAKEAQKLAQIASERQAQREAKGRDGSKPVVVSTDPEAVIQPRKDGAVRPAYKASTMMHEAGVIISHSVHASSETAAVAGLLEGHRKLFGSDPKTLLMDAGYSNGALLADVAERGIDVLCPSGCPVTDEGWEKKGNKGLFHKNRFVYDEATNSYRCPAGQSLTYSEKARDQEGRAYWKYRTRACGDCPLRAQCTESKAGRSVQRYEYEEYKEAMARVLEQPGARRMYRRRMAMGERVNAEMRERMGLQRILRRGRRGASVEFGIFAIAFNLKRVIGGRRRTLLGVFECRKDAHNWRIERAVWLVLDQERADEGLT